MDQKLTQALRTFESGLFRVFIIFLLLMSLPGWAILWGRIPEPFAALPLISQIASKTTNFPLIGAFVLAYGLSIWGYRRHVARPAARIRELAESSASMARDPADSDRQYWQPRVEARQTVYASLESLAAITRQVCQQARKSKQQVCGQAQSVEQIAGCLKALAALTGENQAHARTMETQMAAVKKAVSGANETLVGLSVSVAEIEQGVADAARIAETIQKMAFQTQILSMNASIQAAHAGAAGQGFSVVAEAVNNLAVQAAQAVAETRERMDNARKRVQEGEALAENARDGFAAVTGHVLEMEQGIAGIVRGCQSQSQNTDQAVELVEAFQRQCGRNAQCMSAFVSRSDDLVAKLDSSKRLAERMAR